MMYEEYTQKVLKIARIKNKIRKFRALIILSVLVVVGLISTLLGITGIMTEQTSCPSVISYGQDLGFEVSAIMSDVYYQYRLSGKSEWIDGQPRAAGNYEVRAVTKNSFGELKYSDVHTITIKAKNIEIFVIQSTLAYGDVPLLSGSTMFNDKIVCNKYIYGDETKKETTICPDMESLKIVDENNVDVSTSYNITVRETDVTLTNRAITLTVPTKTSTYNGKPIVFTDTPIVTSGSLAPGDEIRAQFSASQTTIGSTPNTPTVKIYSENNKDVTANYDITTDFGEIVVEKRPLVINTHGLEVVYDGTDHSNIKVEADSQTPLVEGHKIKVVSYSTIKYVGEIENVIDIVVLDENNNNVSDNYAKSFAADSNGSKIVVKPRSIKIATKSKAFVYDGLDHSFADSFETQFDGFDGLAADEEIVPYGIVTSVKNYNNGQKVENVLRVNIYHGTDDVTSNYDIKYEYGLLEIIQRPFAFESASETKTYSGVAWSNSKWDYTGIPLVTGHELIISGNPSIKNVGEIENKFESYTVEATIDGKKVDVTANYEITPKWGLLKVTKKDITIQANSQKKIYDGTALSDSGVTATGLLSLHNVIASSTGTITEAGTIKNIISAVVTIVEKTNPNEDVTSNYNITKENGDLTVLPREIRVQSLDTSKIYDGTKIAGNYSINVGMTGITKAIADGQAAHVEINDVTNVSQTGTKGTFDLDNFYIINDKAVKVTSKKSETTDVDGNRVVDFKNYIVTFVETGVLTIYPRKISVTTKSYDWVYDGQTHTYAYSDTNQDAIVFDLVSNGTTEGALVEGHKFTVTMSAAVTNVSQGKVNNTYSALIIKDANNQKMYDADDTSIVDNYQIDAEDVHIGELFINPISIVVKANGKTKVYDGQSLVYTDYTLTYVATDDKNVVIKYAQADDGIITGSKETESSILPNVDKDKFAIVGSEYFTFTSTEIGPNVTAATKNVISFNLTSGEATNYTFNDEESTGMLEITKIELTITTRSDSKVYDGTALIAGYDVTGSIATDQVIDLETANNIINVAQTEDLNNEITSFDIYTSSGKTQSALIQNKSEVIVDGKTIDYGNYVITFAFGKLTITPIEVTYTTGSANKVYDGLALTSVEGTFAYTIGTTDYNKTNSDFPLTIISGEVITYISTEIGPHVTPATNNDFTFKLNGAEMTTNYEFAIKLVDDVPQYGKLTITAREITITTGSAEKTYDGVNYAGEYTIESTPIEDNKSYKLTAGVLAGSQTLEVTTHAMKNVKDSGKNTISSIAIKDGGVDVLDTAELLNDNGTVDFGNYKITFVFGTITVNKFEIKYELDGANFVYSGEKVAKEGVIFTYKSSNTSDTIVTYTSYSSAPVASGSGVAPTILDNTFAIFNNEALSITAKQFGPNVNGTGEDNEFIASISEGYDIDNYDFVATSVGKIKITPIIITITTDNVTKEYDGEVLIGTYKKEDDPSTPWISGRTIKATLSQTLTKDVTTSDVDNKVLAFDIVYMVDENEVSDIVRPNTETFNGVQDYGNYQITFVNTGKLRINPLTIKYTTADGDHTYDGTKFSKPEGTFKYTPNGGTETTITVENQSFCIIDGEVFTYTSTEIGPQVTAATDNVFEFKLNGESTYTNYNFVLSGGTYGQIEINERQIALLTKGAIWVYDGKAHSYWFNDYDDAVSVKSEIKLADGDYIYSVEMTTTITDANANSLGVVNLEVNNLFNPNKVVIKHKVLEGEDIDVSSSYDVSVYKENSVEVYGQLVVKQIKIEYSTKTDTKVYDGTVLSNNKSDITVKRADEKSTFKTTSFTVIEGEELAYTSTEIGPNVTAAINNEFTFTLNGGAMSSNYEFEVIETGTLSITPRYITVTTGSASKQYDGLTYSGDYYIKGVVIPDHKCGLVTVGELATGQTLSLTLVAVSANASDTPYVSAVDTIDIRNSTESVLTLSSGKTGRNNDYGNYMISFEEGTIEITPIEILYRIKSIVATYNSTSPVTYSNPNDFYGEAKISGAKVVWDGKGETNGNKKTLVNSEELVVSTTSQTACGIYDNVVISYTVNGGSDLTPSEGNYRFVEDSYNVQRLESGSGLLKIAKEGFKIKIKTNSFNLGTYNGQGHQSTYKSEYNETTNPTNWGYKIEYFYGGVDGSNNYINAETKGYTYEVTMDTAYTDAGAYNNHPNVVIKDSSNKVVTDEFVLEYDYGTLTIDTVKIYYTLDPATYIYDGNYHSNSSTFIGICNSKKYEDVTFTIITGEEIDITTTTEYDYGRYDNIVTSYTVNDAASTNYEFIPSVISKLVIKDPEQIIVHTDSATWNYDGEEHVYNSAKIIGTIDDGHSVTYNWADTAKITNVGEAKNAVTIVIKDAKGNDVTGLYTIDYDSECGTLVMLPMMIVYSSNDASKDYEKGSPLTNPSYEFYVVDQPSLKLVLDKDKNIQLLGTDTITLTSWTSLTQSGVKEENLIKGFKLNGVDVGALILEDESGIVTYADDCNYAFVYGDGTLYINEIGRVEITTRTQSWNYDGKAHSTSTTAYENEESDWGYKVTSCKAKNGENWDDVEYYFDVQFVKSVTDVIEGKVNNEILVKVYSDSAKTIEITEGIKVTVTEGKISIDALGTITIETQGYEGKYDAKAHSAYGDNVTLTDAEYEDSYVTISLDSAAAAYLDEGYTFTFTWDNVSVINVFTGESDDQPVNSGTMSVKDLDSVELVKGFNLVTNFGALVVNPYTIVYSTESASKTWDGDPLYTKSVTLSDGTDSYKYTVNESGKYTISKNTSTAESVVFVSGESLTFDIPNVTEVTAGTPAAITELRANLAITTNYKLTGTSIGTLVVYPQGELYIETNSFTKMYDGTALIPNTTKYVDDNTEWGYKIDTAKTTAALLATDVVISVSFTKTQTNIGTCANEVSITVTLGGEDVTEGITIHPTYGTLEVTPFIITYSSESAEKMFDGTPLNNMVITSTYKVPGTGTIKKVTANTFTIEGTSFDVTILQTTTIATVCTERNVISSIDGFKVMNGGVDVTDCFKFEQETDGIGTLTITARGTIEVSTQGYEWTYDGKEHTKQEESDKSVLADLYGTDVLTATWNAESRITNVGDRDNKLDIVVKAAGVDVTDGYIINATWGKLLVKPVVILYDSGSYSFGYDGEKHSYFDVTVNDINGNPKHIVSTDDASITRKDANNNEDTITITSTLSASDIGQYPNVVLGYKINGVDVVDTATANYIFEGNNLGTITIGSCGSLVITTEDGEWTYDGEEHKNQKYTLDGDLEDGHKYEIVWDDDACVTDARIATNKCTIVITDSAGNPVTNGYQIEYNYGSLRVNPKEITYNTESIKEMYNGYGLSKSSVTITYYDNDGVLQTIKTNTQGEEFTLDGNTFKVTTTILEGLDSVANKAFFKVTNGDLDKSSNYSIVEGTIGTITTLKRGDIKIYTSSGTWIYDTKAHTTGDGTTKVIKSGSGYESSSVRYTDTLYGSDMFKATLKYTNLINVCEYRNEAEYQVLDSTGTINLTKGYVITEEFGTVQIKPFIIGYNSVGDTQTYTGEPLSKFDFTLVNYVDKNGTGYNLNADGVAEHSLVNYHVTDDTAFKVYVSTADKTGFSLQVISSTSIVNPGSTSNFITSFKINGELSTSEDSNIDFKAVNPGKLTISDARIVTIQIDGISAKYDGTAKGLFEVTQDSDLLTISKETNINCELKLTGQITEAGSLTLREFKALNAKNMKFTNEDGDDITSDIAVKFVVKWGDETFESLDADLVVVKKRTITVESGTREKEWDGTALTCNTLEIIYGSLGENDEIVSDGAVTGSITDIGEADNTIDLTKIKIVHNGTQDVTESYKISVSLGTLTITDPDE